MKTIAVENVIYLAPDVATSRDGKHWEPAKPELLSPNLRERFWHALGYHFSYGQPFCVACGLSEKKPRGKDANPEIYG